MGEAEFAAAQPHITLLREMGCEVLILAETSNTIHGNRAVPLSHRPILADAGWPVQATLGGELQTVTTYRPGTDPAGTIPLDPSAIEPLDVLGAKLPA